MNSSHWTRCFREQIIRLDGDSGHDLLHVERVVNSATRFAKAEGGCLEIVLPAAWLHDCVLVSKDSPLRSAASRMASARAVEILESLEYPAEFHGAIAHCIEAHSFSASIPATTLEAGIVQDADRIDALGAIGIARCFTVGGALGRAIYCEEDPLCRRRPPDDSKACVDHFFTKLFRIADTLHTPSAKAEARQRLAFMMRYLDQLALEVGADDADGQE